MFLQNSHVCHADDNYRVVLSTFGYCETQAIVHDLDVLALIRQAAASDIWLQHNHCVKVSFEIILEAARTACLSPETLLIASVKLSHGHLLVRWAAYIERS